MLCGACLWPRADQRRDVVERLRSLSGSSEMVCAGPLVIAHDASVRSVDLGEIVCFVDGRVHGVHERPQQRSGEATDAAAVAERLMREGSAVLTRLRGQFALVVWDKLRQQVMLACDLLALRPLFTRSIIGGTLFATELRDLRQGSASAPTADAETFVGWIAGGHCPEGRTLFAGVERLGPGELLELEPRITRRRTYWTPSYVGTSPAPRAELAAGLHQELQRSIWQHLSGGLNGVVLSGGLDSSIVTAVASEATGGDVSLRTYSTVFPGAEYDESTKVGALARALDLDAATFELKPQGAAWLALRHVVQWQMPLAAPGALIDMSMVSQAATDGATTVLDGQTGDEVLGFAPLLVADRLAHGRLGAVRTLLNRWPLSRPATRQEKLWLVRNLGLKALVPYRLGSFVRSWRTRRTMEPRWLQEQYRRRYAESQDAWAWKTRLSGPRWWRALADTVVWAPHRELRLDYVRNRAAAAGIRAGSGLYDPDLIDFCMKVPPETAFDPEFNRPLAREAMRDLLPDEVRLQREKADLAPFALKILTGPDAVTIERLLNAPTTHIAEFIDIDWLGRQWRERKGSAPAASAFWGIAWRAAIGEAWLRYQSDPEDVRKLLEDPLVRPPAASRIHLPD